MSTGSRRPDSEASTAGVSQSARAAAEVQRVLFEGECRVDVLATDDRGFAYGDGVFETMRAHCGALPWWERHWGRLAAGAHRLGLSLPPEALVIEQAMGLLAGGGGVLRLQVTRGRGGRGYAAAAGGVPTWALSRHEVPVTPPEGIVLRWCETRLALQPLLAGIKHCNRLEQVMARNEWSDPGIHEGLVCSLEGDVVSATAANLFVLRDGEWLTPQVDRCGVAGVCRAWAIDALQARQARIPTADVASAESLFVCNAVRGILPVARLGDVHWPLHPGVVALRARLASEHPAFSSPTQSGSLREP
ncbi:MAG: Aminodeoxychorismate lyase [uncultured Lysobacter sp.]|uniref:Aminodeoxychorismate lyase n=1 Tax=uncultured Lysobacter sp. TaxID=271060 RepID=A0A6J4LS03_9GAMM|nr:MAG: Aminodeoxychorismate lyase [uncultured Lysobacter sp.]